MNPAFCQTIEAISPPVELSFVKTSNGLIAEWTPEYIDAAGEPINSSTAYISSYTVRLEVNGDIGLIKSIDIMLNNNLYATFLPKDLKTYNEKAFIIAKIKLSKAEYNEIYAKVTTAVGVVSSKPIKTFYAKQARVALVIGNSKYENSPPLKNPTNDADSISSALRDLDFQVIMHHNLTYQQMMDAFHEFEKKVRELPVGGVSMFFYAGHGMQIDQQNFLLPVEFKAESAGEAKRRAVDMKNIQDILVAYSEENLNIIILDACRNNPYRTWVRGGEEGLAQLRAAGTIVAFATNAGSTANDGEGRNGLYTGELIKQLRKRQRIDDAFMFTRTAVEELSRKNQSPWLNTNHKGIFFLK